MNAKIVVLIAKPSSLPIGPKLMDFETGSLKSVLPNIPKAPAIPRSVPKKPTNGISLDAISAPNFPHSNQKLTTIRKQKK